MLQLPLGSPFPGAGFEHIRTSPPVQECTELPGVLHHANEVLVYCRDYHEHGDFQKWGGHKNSHPLPSRWMTNGNSEKAADEWAQAWQAGILADTNWKYSIFHLYSNILHLWKSSCLWKITWIILAEMNLSNRALRFHLNNCDRLEGRELNIFCCSPARQGPKQGWEQLIIKYI